MENKHAIIGLLLLNLLYNQSGLKCTNIVWYYWAVQLRSIRFYFDVKYASQQKEMESEYFTNLPLPQCLYCDTLRSLMKRTSNPIVKNMIVCMYGMYGC